jgi:hypothetical protein
MLVLGVSGVMESRFPAQQQHYDPPRPVLEFTRPRYSLAPTSSIELMGEVLSAKEILGNEGLDIREQHRR